MAFGMAVVRATTRERRTAEMKIKVANDYFWHLKPHEETWQPKSAGYTGSIDSAAFENGKLVKKSHEDLAETHDFKSDSANGNFTKRFRALQEVMQGRLCDDSLGSEFVEGLVNLSDLRVTSKLRNSSSKEMSHKGKGQWYGFEHGLDGEKVIFQVNMGKGVQTKPTPVLLGLKVHGDCENPQKVELLVEASGRGENDKLAMVVKLAGKLSIAFQPSIAKIRDFADANSN